MGKWIERDPGYLSFDVYNCTYCGKLIPRHIWLEEVEGQEKPFCNPGCHQSFVTRRSRPTLSNSGTSNPTTTQG
jgi:hypothetical protein